MTDIAGFLLACITEDEAEIEAGQDFAVLDSSGWMGHAATWGRQRALAECDAKRRIVAEHPARYPHSDQPECERCDHFGESVDWPCLTLRLLALPYAEHPDYRQEWRP